ncbi:MAG: glycosyltransferase family 2 protein, partial [Lysobacter sp.]|nr:glycosyltransferase family 2 protein [Lysobacter sp.]
MHAPPPLTAVVTCFNSEATLEQCLASLDFCDELVVLDSGSTDASQAIARRHGARLHVETFRGYAAQKQAAVDHASHDWVLLLDSDEWLPAGAGQMIRAALASGGRAGYWLRRREWMFWHWQHPRSRHNRYLRLFDRRRARLSTHAVHESV